MHHENLPLAPPMSHDRYQDSLLTVTGCECETVGTYQLRNKTCGQWTSQNEVIHVSSATRTMQKSSCSTYGASACMHATSIQSSRIRAGMHMTCPAALHFAFGTTTESMHDPLCLVLLCLRRRWTGQVRSTSKSNSFFWVIYSPMLLCT
jgi:hypothetical protein